MSIQVYQKCLLQLSGLSMQIATAAEEQSSVSNEINNHVIEIKQTSELNWQQTEDVATQMDQLQQDIETISNLANTFISTKK